MRHSLLQTYRTQRDVSQAALSAALGWSQSKLSRLERGTQTLTVDDLNALARALNLTWSERIALLEAETRTEQPAA